MPKLPQAGGSVEVRRFHHLRRNAVHTVRVHQHGNPETHPDVVKHHRKKAGIGVAHQSLRFDARHYLYDLGKGALDEELIDRRHNDRGDHGRQKEHHAEKPRSGKRLVNVVGKDERQRRAYRQPDKPGKQRHGHHRPEQRLARHHGKGVVHIVERPNDFIRQQIVILKSVEYRIELDQHVEHEKLQQRPDHHQAVKNQVILSEFQFVFLI